MFSKSLLFKYLVLTIFIGLSAACNSKDENNESAVATAAPDVNDEITGWTGHPLPIELEEVSGDCLNVQKYFEVIHSLSPAAKARKVTTDFKFRTTGASVPRNFLLRMAAGNFDMLDVDLSQLNDFPKWTQTDCDTVVFSEAGHGEVYEIKQAKKDSLTLENEWKGETEITWKSPQSIEIKTTSLTGDFLCSPNSKGEVTATHLISWGDTSIFTETLNEGSISSSFLSLVAEATGTSVQSLFLSPVAAFALRADDPPTADDPPVVDEPIDEEVPLPVLEEESVVDEDPVEPAVDPVPVAGRPLVVNRLKALDESPVRPDLLQCY